MHDIIVTGSRGFIGSLVCSNLKQPYDEIDLKIGSDHRDIEGRSGTLIYLSSWVKQFESIDRPVKYLENNLTALAQILSNNSFSRVIFPSSSTVYDEYGNLEPKSVYGLTKLAGEYLVKMYCNQCWILRFANPIGVGEQRSILWELADSKKKNRSFALYSGRNIVRDYFHVSFIPTIINMILKDKISPGTFNVGTGVATDCTLFMQDICERYNINHIFIPAPLDILSGYVPTTNLLKAPLINLEEEWLKYL